MTLGEKIKAMNESAIELLRGTPGYGNDTRPLFKSGGYKVEREIGKAYVKIETDTSELDAAIEKAQRLKSLLEEANSVVEELASKEIKIKFSAMTSPTGVSASHNRTDRG